MNNTPSLLELINEVKNIKENTTITDQLDTLNTTIETLSSDLTAKTDTLTESITNLDTKVDEKVAEVTTSIEANKEAIAKTDETVAANTQAIEDNKTLVETTKTELDTKKQNKLVAGDSGNITLVDNVDDNTTTIDVDLTKVATTDALNQEIADRAQADTDLETNLTTKIDDAKTEVKTYVDTEVSNVDGKIDTLISKIETDTETYDNFVADTTNFLAKKSYVDSEIAKIKDTSGDNVNDLLEKINKNSDDILANKALIDTNTANITTNSNSITNLSNALATEVTNRTDADTALDTRVTKLEQDIIDATDAYKAADTALETKLTDAYKAADDTLKTDITTAYETADAKLNTDLTNLINTKQDILTAGANITIVDNEISAVYEFDSTNIEKKLKDLEDNKLDITNIVNHLGDTLKLEPKLVGAQAVQTLDVVLDNDATPTTSAASVSKVDTLVNKKQNKLVAGTGIVLTDNADTTTIAVNQTDSIDSITASEPITFKEVKTDKVVTGREIALKIGVGLEKSATGHLRINTNKVVTVDKLGDLTTLNTTNKNSIVEAVNELDTAYKAADTALETKITKAYTDADNLIKGLITNLDNEVVKKTDIATTTKLGIVKPGDNISIDVTGAISVGKATTTTLGLVKVGTGLSVDTDGLLTTTVYEDATENKKGIVQIGDNIDVTAGIISIPKATAATLGVVKPGNNISVDTDGAISSTTVIAELVDGVTYPAGQIGIVTDGGKKKLVRLTKEHPYSVANQDTALNDGTIVIITDTTISADSGHIEYFVDDREVTNGGFVFYRGCVFKVTADKINLSTVALDDILSDVITTGNDNSSDYDMVFGLTPGDGVSIDKITISNASDGINNKVSVKKATTSTLGGVVVGSGLDVTDGIISNKSNLMLIGFSEYVGTIPANTIVKYGNTLYLANTEFDKPTTDTTFDSVKTNLTPISSSDTSIIRYNDIPSGDTIKAGQLLTYTAVDGTTKLYVATKDITIDNTDKATQFTNSLANGDIAASSVTGDLEDITKQIQAQVATKANLVVPSVANSAIKTGQLFVNNNQLHIAKTDIPQNGSLTSSNSQLVVDLSSYATTAVVNTELSKKMDLIPIATVGNKYSAGQLVLVNDVLYRVKTAITNYATTDVSTKLVKIVDLSTTDAEITALKTKVNSNTTNLTNLTTRVTTAEGKITINTTDITTLKTKTGIDNISTIDTAINANGANGDLVTIIKALYSKVKDLETELSKYVKVDYLDSVVYSANTILELTDSSNTFVYNNTTKTAKVGTKQTFTIATDATSIGLTSSNTAAATAAISGKVLTITPVAAGTTTVTLTATASGKSQATFKLIFTVSA